MTVPTLPATGQTLYAVTPNGIVVGLIITDAEHTPSEAGDFVRIRRIIEEGTTGLTEQDVHYLTKTNLRCTADGFKGMPLVFTDIEEAGKAALPLSRMALTYMNQEKERQSQREEETRLAICTSRNRFLHN